MAHEAVKIELTNGTGNPRRFTCADTPAITKGSILKLTDPRTAAQSAAAGEACAGIASMDKESGDGALTISCWTDGVFDLYASGAIAVGAPVITTGQANEVKSAGLGTTAASGAQILGYALEAADDAETIAVRVRL